MDNTQTQTQVQALRTLQQSYDTLADASSAQATSTALEVAKDAILTAIGALNNPSVSDIQNGLAKQGDNDNATNSVILSAVESIDVEPANQVAQFFGLPEALPDYSEVITDIEITTELENIMSVIDPDFDEVVPIDDSSDNE